MIVDKSGCMGQALAKEITGGVYRGGDKLPGERKLCDYFNVSRTTARAVLNDFEKSGIIIRKPRSGAYITEKAVNIIEQALSKPSLKAFFVMPPRQQVNPLIRTVFSTFLEYKDPSIQASILFRDDFNENIPDISGEDIAVVFDIHDDKQVKMLRSHVLKVIILNKKNEECDYISPDNYAGGELIAEHLLECGHTRIACPVFKQNNPDSDFNRRCKGLQDRLKKAGINLKVCLLQGRNEFDSLVYSEAVKIFSEQKVTAIACLSDKMAMNMYAQISAQGMRIPDDFSVIGFDDQYYAQYTSPPLTTIKYPAEALGVRLANFLNEHLLGNPQSINEVIRPIIIKRQSIKDLNE